MGTLFVALLGDSGSLCPKDLERLHKFTITEFYEDQQATTATSEEYKDVDGSGSLMAIIKFMSADPTVKIDNMEAFMFNFGNMNHKTVLHGDELWVYVQKKRAHGDYQP